MAISDRAAAVTTALLQLTAASSIARADLRRHIEQLLRDEFAALQRECAADRRRDDD